jgi:TolA-binding protein
MIGGLRQRMMRCLGTITCLIACTLFFASSVALAQTDSDPTANPDVESLKAEVLALKAEIEALQEKSDQLIEESQQEEKSDLLNQINILRRQVNLKTIALKGLTKSDLDRSLEGIRGKYNEMIRAIEAHRSAARKNTIAKYESLVEEYQGNGVDPEILLRLAYLHFEESHELYGNEMDEYDRTESAGQDPGELPRYDFSESIDIYERVIESYSDYEKIDVAYYLLAYCLLESDDETGAMQTYEALLNKYPDSEIIPEVHVRLGEIYFDRSELDRTLYQKAIDHYHLVKEDSAFYDKALYKLGWTYYKLATVLNLSPLEQAIDYFVRVLEYYESHPTKRLGGGDDLRKESIDYIAISFVDYGDEGMDRATNFFQTSGHDDWNREILRKMVDVYFEADDYDNGHIATRMYLDKYPDDSKNPQVHLRLVENLRREGKWDEAMVESERIAVLYGPRSQWAQNNRASSKDQLKADKTRMVLLYSSATFHHEQAQKAVELEDTETVRQEYLKAIGSYETYTKDYPDAKEYSEAKFNLGEAYFATEQYLKAAKSYAIVSQMEDFDKRADARFNLVKSLEKKVEADGGLPNKEERERIQSGQETESASGVNAMNIIQYPLTQTARVYVAALKDYASRAEGKVNPGDFYYEAASVLFWFGHVSEAIEEFNAIMRDYPRTKAADASKFYALEGAKIAGDLKKYQSILSENLSADPSQRQKEINMAATAGLIMATELAGQDLHSEAIAAYQAIYDKNPGAKDAPAALHNMAVIYETKLNRLYDANIYFVRVADEYPKYEKSADDLFHAAVNYERLADFEKAQSAYQRFASIFPKHAQTKNALYNAAAMAIKDEDYSNAAEQVRRYARAFPEAGDAGELLFITAKSAAENDQSDFAMMTYREFTENYTDNPARLVEAYVNMGADQYEQMGYDAAKRNLQLGLAVYERFAGEIPEAKGFAAQAKFILADRSWNQYQALAFTGDLKKDADILKNLLLGYKDLNGIYQDVASYADFEWFTAAAYMIGMINREFSQALFTAPIPDGLSPEQEDQYITKLEEIAFPIKQKAIDAFLENVKKGNQERIRNEWIDMSSNMLNFYETNNPDKKWEAPHVTDGVAFSGVEFDLTMKKTQAASSAGAKK